MTKISPDVISKTLEGTVSSFFEQIEAQISAAEQEVMTKIESSTNLRELEILLSKQRDSFGMDMEKEYEQGRMEIDANIDRGCFGTVVQKKQYYDNLINQMRSNHERMQKTVEEG